MIEFMADLILKAAVVIVFLLIFIGIPLFIYASIQEADRPAFSLKKDDWVCSHSHEEQSTYYIKSGAVMVPMTSHSTVCDQWSHK